MVYVKKADLTRESIRDHIVDLAMRNAPDWQIEEAIELSRGVIDRDKAQKHYGICARCGLQHQIDLTSPTLGCPGRSYILREAMAENTEIINKLPVWTEDMTGETFSSDDVDVSGIPPNVVRGAMGLPKFGTPEWKKHQKEKYGSKGGLVYGVDNGFLPDGEVRTTSSTGAEKGMKPERFDLIPVEALATLARLYGRGAEKYAAHNWRKGYEWSKSYSALNRHLTAFWGGEDIDEETGMPHMACVAFHAFTLMTFMEEQRDFDDRYKPEIDSAVLKKQKAGGDKPWLYPINGPFLEWAPGMAKVKFEFTKQFSILIDPADFEDRKLSYRWIIKVAADRGLKVTTKDIEGFTLTLANSTERDYLDKREKPSN